MKQSTKKKIDKILSGILITTIIFRVTFLSTGYTISNGTQIFNVNPNDIVSSKYICWVNSSVSNSSDVENMSLIYDIKKTIPNATISAQQNFILVNKSNFTDQIWVQFVYFINSKFLTTQEWHNNKTTNYTDYYFNGVSMPKEIVMTNYLINNNSTIKAVFNFINPNQTYALYYKIPKNYKILNIKIPGYKYSEPYETYGYYNNYNLEVDFNNMPKNYMFLSYGYDSGYYLVKNNTYTNLKTALHFGICQ